MSCKLVPNGCTFPTRSEAGIIYIDVGGIEIKVEVPWIKSQTFQSSNQYFDNSDIMIHMKNMNYEIVLRRDGTATAYNLDGYVVLTKTWEVPKIEDYFSIQHVGISSTEDRQDLYSVTEYYSNDSKVLILDSAAVVAGYKVDISSNAKLGADLCRGTEFNPVFVINTNESVNAFSVKSGNKIIYNVKGSFISITGKEILI